MRAYFIDQLLLLTVGVGIILAIPFFCGPVFACIFEVMTVLGWGYLCRRILLFPVDLLCGKQTKQVFFGSQNGLVDYEFFTRKYSVEWKLYFEGHGRICVLVPVSVARDEIVLIKQPQRDECINITYYRFSKILLDWEPVIYDTNQR